MELAVVMAGGLQRSADGRVRLPAKAVSGMTAYAEHWPGPVRMVARPTTSDVSGDLGSDWRAPGDLPFAVEVVDEPVPALSGRRDVAVLAGLAPENAALVGSGTPVVLVVENTPRNQATYAVQSGATSLGDQVRIGLGAVRRDRRQRAQVREAAGLQCNGWPAFDAYARFSRSPLLYLDSRITAATVDRARSAPAYDGTRPLRLAFSGRWVAPKGVRHVVDLARTLERRGVAATVEVIGAGPLEAALRASAPASVTFTAPLDFEPAWTEHVADHVDVMVLPHTQADPSGSYLEALACGAPVLSFANDYAVRLADASGAAWTVPTGDTDALADRVAHLAARPAELAAARERGLRFMAAHTFQHEFRARVDHVRAAVGA